jgi:hypothetical protein
MLASVFGIGRAQKSRMLLFFLFAFTGASGKERHSVNFEFEISRYAAVVGKSRVCLSLSRLRRVHERRLGRQTLYSADLRSEACECAVISSCVCT